MVKHIRIENAKNTKKKTNSITITIKRKYEKKTKPYKDKDKYYEKNSKHRAENREAMRQTQREKYKKNKDKNECRKKRKTKKIKQRRTVTNQPTVVHAYCTFYSFHLVYSIYYSSYHDQLISLFISVRSIDFSFLSLIHSCPFLYQIS